MIYDRNLWGFVPAQFQFWLWMRVEVKSNAQHKWSTREQGASSKVAVHPSRYSGHGICIPMKLPGRNGIRSPAGIQ